MPVQKLREEFERQCRAAPEWDGRVVNVQVTDANEHAIQVRGLCSASNADRAWDLRCRLREGLVDFVRREYPTSLPKLRVQAERRAAAAARS
ncbi:MAG TPA: hypothetical protein VEG27_07925 [Usitatibacter sp.]|nr:hypothetical protein [Usitatibacter sp.]